MKPSNSLLSVLVCPRCKGEVRLSNEEGVICNRCQLLYPIRDGIPVMIAEGAVPAGEVSGGERAGGGSRSATFKVVEGGSEGLEVRLPPGYCCGLGRSLDDAESTHIFDSRGVVSLDDSTKQLVLNFISQKFRGSEECGSSSRKGDDVGDFRRLPDLTLADGSVSRLHAMIFNGSTGVGLLDLVSKNGTFINGVEVESRFLKEGDIVSVGATKIKVNISE